MVAALAAVCAVASRGLIQWSAIVVLLFATAPAWATLREHLGAFAPRPALLMALPVALLVGVSAWMLWPLITGEPPASRDHAIHYFQARILVDEMLPSGRLSGWSERFNHGFPFGEGYPTLGVLWVSAAHLLSFGVIDLRTSYAWGLLAVWALSLWGVWRIAAAIAADVRARHDPAAHENDLFGRWAGCAGAFAWLLDPGAARQGGWSYLMFHGVWPQQLSTALWVAALVWTLRALRHPSPRKIAIAAIMLAASLLAHPFGLLTAASSAVGLVLVAVLAHDARAWPAGRLRVLALVYGLAVALAFAGVATFLAASSELGRSPVPWAEFGELAVRFAMGDLWAGPWAWTGTLAVVGLGLALWSGRASAWLVAGLCCAMLLLGSRDAITVLRLDLLASGFKNLQFPRFAIAIKPLAFALAGAAAVVVARALQSALRGAATIVGPGPRIFLAIVLAPALATMFARADLLARRPVASIDTLARSDLAAEEQALRAALADQASVTPAMRVAFLRADMGGGTYPMFSIADAGAAAVLDGHVATVNFDHLIERRSPEILQRIGVTHVLHDLPLGSDDADLAAVLEDLGTFGPYTLARFGLPPDTAPRFVHDRGFVTEIEHTAESRTFDVETAGGTLELAQAPSDRWQWALDGEPLESITTSLRGGIEWLAVAVPHSGRVTLSYTTRASERYGRWISLLALLIVLLMLTRRHPLALAERLHSPLVTKLSLAAMTLAAALLVGLAARRQNAQLETTWHEYADARFFARREPPGFVEDLTIADDIVVERGARPVCDGLLGKDALVDCEEGDYRPNSSFVYIEPFLYRCLAFGIAAGDTATVGLGTAGDQVVGFALRRGKEGKGRHLRFGVGGGLQILGNRRADLHFEPQSNPDGALVTIENASDSPEQVCVGGARFASQ